MRKLHTFIRTAALTGIFILMAAHSARAAGWQQDQMGWRYEKEDGTYAAGVWHYFDGNGDSEFIR